MIRRVAGLVLILGGLWIGYAKAQGLSFYIARGTPVSEALGQPAFFLPLAAAILAMIAGLLALLALRGGAWLGWLATLLAAVFGGAILGAGADRSLWLEPVIIAAVYALASLVLSLRQRTA